MNLASIRVLFRAPDTLALYGIPYDMRERQAPLDLWRASDTHPHGGARADWMWLGQPGWFGHMSEDEMHTVCEFLHWYNDKIPGGPYEWTRLARPVLDIEPFVHNGYDVVKRPVHGFMASYGKWRHLLWRETADLARRDAEAYLRSDNRWLEP